MDSIPKRTYRAVVDVRHGDCREVIKGIESCSLDSCVTDPPYHLVAMTKRFGAAGSAPAKSADHQRIARGFMQTEWDGTGISFDPALWAEVLRVLKPGGFCLVFGAPRTYHRLTCAIEDAGFVIQDCLMWMFGQGWPKRRDMLKPAYEPVVMAYKPGAPRYLNIDGCRIPLEDGEEVFERHDEPTQDERYEDRGYAAKPGRRIGPPLWGGPMKRLSGAPGQEGRLVERAPPAEGGRWPPNVVLDDSEEVYEAFAAVGDRASGTGAVKRESGAGYRPNAFGGENRPAGTPNIEYGDSGSVARFFWHAKAGREDRWGSKHPSVKPVDLIRYLARLVTPPGGTIIDPFAGSGTAGVAALAEGVDAILIEREQAYYDDIMARMSFYEGGGRHSTAAKARSATPRGTLPLFEDQP